MKEYDYPRWRVAVLVDQKWAWMRPSGEDPYEWPTFDAAQKTAKNFDACLSVVQGDAWREGKVKVIGIPSGVKANLYLPDYEGTT